MNHLIWVLGTKPGPSTGVTKVPNHWTIFSAPSSLFKISIQSNGFHYGIFKQFLIVFIYLLYVYVYTHTHMCPLMFATVHGWRSKENFQELILSLHHVGSRDENQIWRQAPLPTWVIFAAPYFVFVAPSFLPTPALPRTFLPWTVPFYPQLSPFRITYILLSSVLVWIKMAPMGWEIWMLNH